MAVLHEYRRASLAPPRQEEVPHADVFSKCCDSAVTQDGSILSGSRLIRVFYSLETTRYLQV